MRLRRREEHVQPQEVGEPGDEVGLIDDKLLFEPHGEAVARKTAVPAYRSPWDMDEMDKDTVQVARRCRWVFLGLEKFWHGIGNVQTGL